MATVASKIGEVRGKATSYKTAYLKAVDYRTGWVHYILGYSKTSGICTVLVQSPICPGGEYGTCYYQDVAGLPVEEGFTVKPAEEVRRSLR